MRNHKNRQSTHSSSCDKRTFAFLIVRSPDLSHFPRNDGHAKQQQVFISPAVGSNRGFSAEKKRNDGAVITAFSTKGQGTAGKRYF